MERTNRTKFSGLDLKSMNRNSIYNMLWREGRASKQDVVQRLGLSLPTVTNNLATLCEEGLVVENGSFGNTGGRSAKGFSINPMARMAVGVDVNKTHVSVVAVNPHGEIVHSVHERRLYENTPAYFQRVGTLTESIIKEAQISPQMLLGVGISVQGLISADRRQVIYGPILNNTGDTVDVLAEYIPYSCELFHDAESSAFAERWVSPDILHAVYLSLSTNLGGAIIFDRNIFAGSGATAGKLEHMTLHPNGLPCYCGKLGCAESYCSIIHLTDGICNGHDEFFQLLEDHNAKAETRWNAYLQDLAILVNSLYMLMDCDIIIGGYLAPYMEKYVGRLKQVAYARNGVFPQNDYIKLGRFQNEPAAAGAALRYVDGFLKSV